MEKYENILINDPSIFEENILNPESYLGVIENKFNILKTQILKGDHSSQWLCDFFTQKFKSDKIVFVNNLQSSIESTGVYKGAYEPNKNLIYLYCDFNIEDIQYNEDDYDFFKIDCIEFCGHELVHRLQFVKDKIKNISTHKAKNGRDELIKYLSDSKEIMAHAWQIVQIYKFYMGKNLDKDFLLKKIAERNVKYIGSNKILWLYLKYFDKNSKVFKLLYKYIYLYLQNY